MVSRVTLKQLKQTNSLRLSQFRLDTKIKLSDQMQMELILQNQTNSHQIKYKVQMILINIIKKQIVEMGRKNSSHSQGSDFESEPQELTLEQQVENKIKQLPNLKEKVQAIALNHYILQKRKIELEMAAEINKLEIEFRKRYAPLVEQVNNIVSGTHDYADADFQANTILTEQQNGLKHNYYKKELFEEYWFKALISSDVIGQEIRQIDEPLIKHLTRVEATKESENSLKVVFTFSQNEWFTNKTLTKEFEIQGDQIKRSFGDEINWKEGKNITIKIIKKKNKNKKKTIQKEVESFFNLFKEIDLTQDDEEDKDEPQENEDEEDDQISKLERQYEIANEFYENLVPRSFEYFLGVVGGDFGDFGDLGDLQGIEEGDQNEEEEAPKKKKGKGKRKGSNASQGGDE